MGGFVSAYDTKFYVDVFMEEDLSVGTIRIEIFDYAGSLEEFFSGEGMNESTIKKIKEAANGRKIFPIWRLAGITYDSDVNERKGRKAEYAKYSVKKLVDVATYYNEAKQRWGLNLAEGEKPRSLFAVYDKANSDLSTLTAETSALREYGFRVVSETKTKVLFFRNV
jgi:hypothetical protein